MGVPGADGSSIAERSRDGSSIVADQVLPSVASNSLKGKEPMYLVSVGVSMPPIPSSSQPTHRFPPATLF